MSQSRAGILRRCIGVAVVLSTSAIGVGVGPATGQAASLGGGAFGFSSSVSLFNGPAAAKGPEPKVELPAGGSATPITATAATASAIYGPATIFSSGKIDVSTKGSDGTVESSANLVAVDPEGDAVFTAATLTSTCTASSSGSSGTTKMTGGKLRTSEGDPDADGDDKVVDVPNDPAPNTTIEGKIEAVGDSFRYVFNEQIKNPDGSITVNAAHQYLVGPTAKGDVIIGQVRCSAKGAAPASAPATTSAPAATGTPTPTSAPAVTDPDLPVTGSPGERLYNLALILLLGGAVLLWSTDPWLRRTSTR